jgi:hypothetical protein
MIRRIATIEQRCMSLPFHERVAPLAGVLASAVRVGGSDPSPTGCEMGELT